MYIISNHYIYFMFYFLRLSCSNDRLKKYSFQFFTTFSHNLFYFVPLCLIRSGTDYARLLSTTSHIQLVLFHAQKSLRVVFAIKNDSSCVCVGVYCSCKMNRELTHTLSRTRTHTHRGTHMAVRQKHAFNTEMNLFAMFMS